MVFQNYAKYYDLFYREKDYRSEVDFVMKLGGFVPPMSILDLGCGTGGHMIPLARQGFQMTGVDVSEEMVKQAKQKTLGKQVNVDFFLGDIRSIDLRRRFDAVLSMFAVMGYQTSNDDLYSALQVARHHLLMGGLFIFDAWFGPAVMRERPETRAREIPDGTERVIRIASPEIDVLLNTVTVHYTVLRLRGNQVLDEASESHKVRFFFAPEIAFFAKQSGFVVQSICPFMNSGRLPNDQDWNVTWVLRAV
jgi:SAM-dependent methyltransferase